MLDRSSRDYDSLREGLLALAAEKLPEWTDRSPSDLGVLLIELFAHMGDQLSWYQDRLLEESFLDTAREPRSIRALLDLIGVRRSPARPAWTHVRVTPKANGTLSLPTGAEFLAEDGRTCFTYGGAEVRDTKTAVDLRVVQVQRIEREPLGYASGEPEQRLKLAGAQALPDSVVLFVDGQRWEVTDDLFERQRERAARWVIDDEGALWVAFGDGRNGALPPRGAAVTASYEVTRGAAGNVPVGSITRCADSSLDAQEITNPDPAEGGVDVESFVSARERAPALFRSQERAVTSGDYIAHARRLGAAKVVVRAGSWNRVLVKVALPGGAPLGDVEREALRAGLQEIAVFPVTVVVEEIVSVWINVEIEVKPLPGNVWAHVKRKCEETLTELLDFDRVRLGQRLYVSKVYEAIEALPEIDAVFVNSFERQDGGSGDGVIHLADDELPRCAKITVGRMT